MSINRIGHDAKLPRDSGPKQKLFMLADTLLGGFITMTVVTTLPIAQSTLVSAIALASLIVACAYLSNPMLWWMAVGAIAGVIVGLGGVMAGYLAESKLDFIQSGSVTQ